MPQINITRKMTGKMTGMQSINTDPYSNPFCTKMSQKENVVCSLCYSRKMIAGVYAGCQRPWKENGEILSRAIIPVEELPIINANIFRFSAHGEMINLTMYINYLNIARKNSTTQFTLWTKRRDIINKKGKDGVKNILLVYSSPKIDEKNPKVPEHFDKVFTVYTPEYAQAHQININCGEKRCIECRLCYSKNRVTHINEIMKSKQHIWKHLQEGG